VAAVFNRQAPHHHKPLFKEVYRKAAKVAKGRGGEKLIVICYWLLVIREEKEPLFLWLS
jgi:hypothetical protein